MDYSKVLNIDLGKAICYSGYRKGQTPGEIFPTYNQVLHNIVPWGYKFDNGVKTGGSSLEVILYIWL